MRTTLLLAALLPSTFAHFVLNYPNSLGFDDDNEGESPCGGFGITFASNDTNVTVGSFAVASTSTHPQANWLFRYTTSTEEPYNWTNILPVISQSGIGAFCLPNLNVPESLAGQQGVIQVTQSAADGALYQCAAVNFVAGSDSSIPSTCTNASGITASITTQTSLDANSTSSTTSSTTSSAPSSTASGSAVKQVVGGLLAVLPAALLLI